MIDGFKEGSGACHSARRGTSSYWTILRISAYSILDAARTFRQRTATIRSHGSRVSPFPSNDGRVSAVRASRRRFVHAAEHSREALPGTHQTTDISTRHHDNRRGGNARRQPFVRMIDQACGHSEAPPQLRPSAIALDPVRRNGHQHLGRLKQSQHMSAPYAQLNSAFDIGRRVRIWRTTSVAVCRGA